MAAKMAGPTSRRESRASIYACSWTSLLNHYFESREIQIVNPTTSSEPEGPVAVLSGRSACHRRGSRMVIIHDHACSTTVKLYAIYDSTKMSRSSSTTTRGDRLCDPSRAEQRGGADAAVRVGGHLEAFLLDWGCATTLPRAGLVRVEREEHQEW